jgi:hypothetical protein
MLKETLNKPELDHTGGTTLIIYRFVRKTRRYLYREFESSSIDYLEMRLRI